MANFTRRQALEELQKRGEISKGESSELDSIRSNPKTPPINPAASNDSILSALSEGPGIAASSLSSSIESLKATAGGAAGIIGQKLGIDSLQNAGLESFRQNTADAAAAAPKNVPTFTESKSPADYIRAGFSAIGQVVPSVVESVGTGLVAGAVTGAATGGLATIPGLVGGTLGRSAVKKMIGREIKNIVGKKLGVNLAKASTTVAKTLISGAKGKAAIAGATKAAEIAAGKSLINKGAFIAAAMTVTGVHEGGGMYGEILKENPGIDRDKAANIALTGAAVSSLIEVAPMGAVANNLFRGVGGIPIPNDIKKSWIKQAVKYAAPVIGVEGVTEGAQEVIGLAAKAYATGGFNIKDPTQWRALVSQNADQIINAAAVGAVGGAVMGGPSGTFRSLSERAAQNQQAQIDHEEELRKAGEKTKAADLKQQSLGANIDPDTGKRVKPVAPRKSAAAIRSDNEKANLITESKRAQTARTLDQAAKVAKLKQIKGDKSPNYLEDEITTTGAINLKTGGKKGFTSENKQKSIDDFTNKVLDIFAPSPEAQVELDKLNKSGSVPININGKEINVKKLDKQGKSDVIKGLVDAKLMSPKMAITLTAMEGSPAADYQGVREKLIKETNAMIKESNKNRLKKNLKDGDSHIQSVFNQYAVDLSGRSKAAADALMANGSKLTKEQMVEAINLNNKAAAAADTTPGLAKQISDTGADVPVAIPFEQIKDFNSRAKTNFSNDTVASKDFGDVAENLIELYENKQAPTAKRSKIITRKAAKSFLSNDTAQNQSEFDVQMDKLKGGDEAVNTARAKVDAARNLLPKSPGGGVAILKAKGELSKAQSTRDKILNNINKFKTANPEAYKVLRKGFEDRATKPEVVAGQSKESAQAVEIKNAMEIVGGVNLGRDTSETFAKIKAEFSKINKRYKSGNELTSKQVADLRVMRDKILSTRQGKELQKQRVANVGENINTKISRKSQQAAEDFDKSLSDKGYKSSDKFTQDQRVDVFKKVIEAGGGNKLIKRFNNFVQLKQYISLAEVLSSVSGLKKVFSNLMTIPIDWAGLEANRNAQAGSRDRGLDANDTEFISRIIDDREMVNLLGAMGFSKGLNYKMSGEGIVITKLPEGFNTISSANRRALESKVRDYADNNDITKEKSTEELINDSMDFLDANTKVEQLSGETKGNRVSKADKEIVGGILADTKDLSLDAAEARAQNPEQTANIIEGNKAVPLDVKMNNKVPVDFNEVEQKYLLGINKNLDELRSDTGRRKDHINNLVTRQMDAYIKDAKKANQPIPADLQAIFKDIITRRFGKENPVFGLSPTNNEQVKKRIKEIRSKLESKNMGSERESMLRNELIKLEDGRITSSDRANSMDYATPSGDGVSVVNGILQVNDAIKESDKVLQDKMDSDPDVAASAYWNSVAQAKIAGLDMGQSEEPNPDEALQNLLLEKNTDGSNKYNHGDVIEVGGRYFVVTDNPINIGKSYEFIDSNKLIPDAKGIKRVRVDTVGPAAREELKSLLDELENPYIDDAIEDRPVGTNPDGSVKTQKMGRRDWILLRIDQLPVSQQATVSSNMANTNSVWRGYGRMLYPSNKGGSILVDADGILADPAMVQLMQSGTGESTVFDTRNNTIKELETELKRLNKETGADQGLIDYYTNELAWYKDISNQIGEFGAKTSKTSDMRAPANFDLQKLRQYHNPETLSGALAQLPGTVGKFNQEEYTQLGNDNSNIISINVDTVSGDNQEGYNIEFDGKTPPVSDAGVSGQIPGATEKAIYSSQYDNIINGEEDISPFDAIDKGTEDLNKDAYDNEGNLLPLDFTQNSISRKTKSKLSGEEISYLRKRARQMLPDWLAPNFEVSESDTNIVGEFRPKDDPIDSVIWMSVLQETGQSENVLAHEVAHPLYTYALSRGEVKVIDTALRPNSRVSKQLAKILMDEGINVSRNQLAAGESLGYAIQFKDRLNFNVFQGKILGKIETFIRKVISWVRTGEFNNSFKDIIDGIGAGRFNKRGPLSPNEVNTRKGLADSFKDKKVVNMSDKEFSKWLEGARLKKKGPFGELEGLNQMASNALWSVIDHTIGQKDADQIINKLLQSDTLTEGEKDQIRRNNIYKSTSMVNAMSSFINSVWFDEIPGVDKDNFVGGRSNKLGLQARISKDLEGVFENNTDRSGAVKFFQEEFVLKYWNEDNSNNVRIGKYQELAGNFIESKEKFKEDLVDFVNRVSKNSGVLMASGISEIEFVNSLAAPPNEQSLKQKGPRKIAGTASTQVYDFTSDVIDTADYGDISNDTGENTLFEGGDPLKYMKSRLSTFARVAQNNIIMQNIDKINEMGDDIGEGKTIWTSDPDYADKLKRVQFVWSNGKVQERFVNDELMFKSLMSINRPGSNNALFKAAVRAKQLATKFIVMTPTFALYTIARDPAWAYISGELDKPISGPLKAFWDLATNKDIVQEAKMSGSAYFDISVNRDGTKNTKSNVSYKDVAGYLAEDIKKGRVLETSKDVLRLWKKLISDVEMSTRLAVFKEQKSKSPDLNSREVAYNTLDLMNFKRRGGSGLVNMLIDTTPFLNPRIQSHLKLGRLAKYNTFKMFGGQGSFKDPEQKFGINWRNTFTRGAMMTAATVAMFLWNKDDKDYQELPDWDKSMFHHIKLGNGFIRVAKPFELGAIFSTLPQMAMEAMKGDRDFGEFTKAMQYLVTHNAYDFQAFIPLIMRPLVELGIPYSDDHGRNLFNGAPIIPEYLQAANVNDQFKSSTSDLSKVMANSIANVPGLGISPLKFEHLIKTFFGTLGVYALAGTDAMMQNTGVSKALGYSTKPSGGYDKVIEKLYGKLYTKNRRPPTSSLSSNRYYDLVKELKTLRFTEKDLLARGKFKQYVKFIRDNAPLKAVQKSVGRTKSKISKMRVRIRRIENSNLSPDSKRRNIDLLKQVIYNLSKSSSENFRSVKGLR